MIHKNIQETVPSILQLVVMFGYMISLDWQLSLATLLLAPLVAVLVSSFAGRVLTAAERSQKQVSELAGLLGEAISGLPLVRAFAAEPWLQQRFEEEIEQHRRARYRTCVAGAAAPGGGPSKRLASWPSFDRGSADQCGGSQWCRLQQLHCSAVDPH